MYFAYILVLFGCIPHLLQNSLIASGRSTVDELDRRLRPDRSILSLIDFARNNTSTSFAVLLSIEGRTEGARLLRRRPSGIDIESPSTTREITDSPIHAVQTPSRASLARSEGQPSMDTKLSSRRKGERRCLRDARKLTTFTSFYFFFFFLNK